MICLLLLFVFVSVFFIDSRSVNTEKENSSSDLIKKEIKNDNQETIEYYDNDGNLAIASDLGYAVRTVTKDGETETEEYFGTDREKIQLQAGCFSMFREYDEDGRKCTTTYLDENGKPVRIKRGYAILLRTYYVSSGPENGKLEDEFYYDENGEPVCLSLGEYGIHREYDGDTGSSILTYLDTAGEPLVTKAGYTKVARKWNEDRTEYQDQYYDINGNAISLSEGQYGVSHIEGETIYLNENGQRVFNLRQYIYSHPRYIVLVAALIVLISAFLNKPLNILMFAAYALGIAYFTLMFRTQNETGALSEFFWAYKQLFSNAGVRADILKNIWLFIPLGAILYQLWPKKIMLLVPVFLSIAIEGMQYFLGTGYCELDDVISNGLGGCIGFSAGKLTRDLRTRIKNWKQAYSK